MTLKCDRGLAPKRNEIIKKAGAQPRQGGGNLGRKGGRKEKNEGGILGSLKGKSNSRGEHKVEPRKTLPDSDLVGRGLEMWERETPREGSKI